MARVKLTESLREEYVDLFDSCLVKGTREDQVEKLVDRLIANRSRYQKVEDARGIPWHFVAVVHNMESGQKFSGHLHNGDPLNARTVRVPAGRPKNGKPPFTWEDSAADALAIRGLGTGKEWTLAGTLYEIEGFNGFGYRLYHPHVLSPYLWSFSQHYTRGKYVADGTWSDTAPSRQCGAAVLLRRLAERGQVAFADLPIPREDAKPLVSRYAARRPRSQSAIEQATELQKWLSTHPGIFLKPDGIAGKQTSAAYRKVTGYYLPGDSRGS